MSLRWGIVGNTVSDLTGPRFEPQTIHSRDERVTARPKHEIEICEHYLKTVILGLNFTGSYRQRKKYYSIDI